MPNPIARVLVAVDDLPASKARVAFAASLAQSFGAKLIGAASARAEVPVYAPFGDGLLTIQPNIQEAIQRMVEKQLAAASAQFVEGSKGAATEWRSAQGKLPEEFLVEQTRTADVAVLGPALDAKDGSALAADPGDIVLACGRPVVVVPPSTERYSNARVLVAWKQGMAARRAMLDAVPYLVGAEDVVVCAVDAKDKGEELADVVAFLTAHGIKARALLEASKGEADAAALRRVCAEVKATLIVAGAYGRSRLREWVFGGVTRDLLSAPPVPCLLSH